MKSTDPSPLNDLSNPLALLSRGAGALAKWLEKRSEDRYQEFIRTALESDVFPENADGMTSKDFLAMLRALDLDIEAEKSAVYGRLARSIAMEHIGDHFKRYFIKALSEFSFSQVDLLRKALIAERHDLFPATGSGRVEPKEFLGLNSKRGIDLQTFERWGMIEESTLSPAGRKFVESCFNSEELQPAAVGLREWAKGRIHIVCNEMSSPCCQTFLLRLTDEGHRKAIRVHNGAAFSGQALRPMFSGSVMVVLLTENPLRLSAEWPAVEHAIRGRAITVVATTAPDAPIPSVMENFEQIDASAARAGEAVEALLARFEGQGFRKS